MLNVCSRTNGPRRPDMLRLDCPGTLNNLQIHLGSVSDGQAAPNSPTLTVCHSPANAVPCTNYATTYKGAGIASPNGAQDTPDPNALTSACQSTGDGQGNIGFWAPAGTYDYTVCIGLNCYGHCTITIGGSGRW
jgi:hypothetical protein